MLELLLGLGLSSSAERYVFSAEGAAAPDLLNAEALQEIRDRERRGRIDSTRSREAADDLLALPIARYPTLQLVERAWSLRHNFTAYDAMYVALAEALDAPLVTADGRLARAVREHSGAAAIELKD